MKWPWTKPRPAGLWGEQQAERFLRRKGLHILGRRVRIGRRDEIDLIARHDRTLIFVEVKTRRGEEYGRPADAVDRAKKRAMSRAAVAYLKTLRYPAMYLRFDVIEVIGEERGASPTIRHIENAFPLDNRYRLPW